MSLRSFTLHDQIERNAWLHRDQVAFIYGDLCVTHAQYATRVARLAAGLAASGVNVGERVAILAQNCLEYVDLFGAAARLGAIVVPVNWRLSAEEVTYVLQDTTPSVLIAAPDLHALVPEEVRKNMLSFTTGDSQAGAWRSLGELYLDAVTPPVAIDHDAGLVIVHTAAVGGRPRGALLSHHGLLRAAAQLQQAWKLTPTDVLLGVLPLFHIAGIGFTFGLLVAGGASIVLSRFDPKALVGLIDDRGGSVMGSFPPMLGSLLDAAAESGSTLSNLRVVTGIDTRETLERFSGACPNADFWAVYGQTETSGSVTMARFSEKPGSAGRPVAQHVVAIVDEIDHAVPQGTVGEIVVRGPMVFLGYWNRDQDNAFTFRDGWHHTGDTGHLDSDGYLWYAGPSPAKELIKPGGENVYPAEVERALLQHPDVFEAVVFGVPDAQWGEAVRAVCVLKPGSALDADVLIEFVGQRMARYKKPKHVIFATALPRTAAGRIDRIAAKAKHTQA